MLRRQLNEAIFAGFACLLFGFGFADCASSQPSLSAKTDQASQHDQETEFWPPLLGYRLKVTDTLLAGFTFLLFLATVALWGSTRKLVQRADKNSERQLRAYIAVRPSKAINVYPEKTPQIDFIIENTGQTPAYKVRYVAIAEILDHPLVDNQGDLVQPDPAGKLPAQVIHSHAHISGEAVSEKAVTFEEYAKMVGSTHRFYLAGIVLYEDVFGAERMTKFCAYVGGPEYQKIATAAFATRTPISTVEWTFAHVHNEAN
jgi:hypothetical protein